MADADTKKANQVELYKLEYDKAATRYEDIYKAVWQNFSYMAILAGAILTFGKDALGASAAALLACVPLLLWFWATYEPLNRYGQQVEKRLSEIEKILNHEFFSEERFTGSTDDRPGLHHYTDFREMRVEGGRDERNTSGVTKLSRQGKGTFLLAAIIAAGLFLSTKMWSTFPRVTNGLLVFALLVAFGVLFRRFLLKHSRAKIGIRLFAVALHAAFFLLLGRWFFQPSVQASPSLTSSVARIEIRSPTLTINASGPPAAIHRILLVALSEDSNLSPRANVASSPTVATCADVLRSELRRLEEMIARSCSAESLLPAEKPSPGGKE